MITSEESASVTQRFNLNEPAISALFLFSANELNSKEADVVCSRWIEKGFKRKPLPGIPEHYECTVIDRYDNRIQCELDWEMAHDTHLLRLTLSLPNIQPHTQWKHLREYLDEQIKILWSGAKPVAYPFPFGRSIIYRTLVSPSARSIEAKIYIENDWFGLVDCPVEVDMTPWGMLVPLQEISKESNEREVSERTLAFFVFEDRHQHAEQYVVNPLSQGLSRLELYLHKVLYSENRNRKNIEQVLETRRRLEKSARNELAGNNFHNYHRESNEFRDVIATLTKLIEQEYTVQSEIHTLRTNLKNLRINIDRICLGETHYTQKCGEADHLLEQASSDLIYVEKTREAARNLQDIHREVASFQMARASFWIGAAAALLAFIGIYDNFIEAWGLIVQDSHLRMPSPEVRFFITGVVAVSFPLSAYWMVKKDWWKAAFTFLLGLLAVAGASTLR